MAMRPAASVAQPAAALTTPVAPPQAIPRPLATKEPPANPAAARKRVREVQPPGVGAVGRRALAAPSLLSQWNSEGERMRDEVRLGVESVEEVMQLCLANVECGLVRLREAHEQACREQFDHFASTVRADVRAALMNALRPVSTDKNVTCAARRLQDAMPED